MSIQKQGFSLIELIVVLIITAILAQIGFVAFNKYLRRTRAFAAKTALLNIKKECESNSDLKSAEEFTALAPKGYSLFSGTSGDCNGNNGLIFARPNNPNRLPEYSYNFAERGGIQCSKNSSDNFFKECMTLKDKLESNEIVVKDSYLERGCSAYVIVEGRNWQEAEKNSQKLGGHLVTVNDKAENDWLTKNLKWLEPKNPNFGAYGWDKEVTYWIGLREVGNVRNQNSRSFEEQRKNLIWADGTSVDYINQGRTDGNHDEDWFGLNSDGEFADMHDPLSKGDLSQGPTQTGAARDWQQMQYGITEIDQCNS